MISKWFGSKEGLLPVGTTLNNGKYLIERYLSSGGFGNTYEATDTTFNVKVAIKELFIKGVCGRSQNNIQVSVDLCANQRIFSAQLNKFRKEAKRLRKLNNAHIVKVHDLFDENGTSYYVMDFIEGETLAEKIANSQKPFSEDNVKDILSQILNALDAVHHEQIWHLDLKPGNIMIDKSGKIKLIDFGASKQLRNSDGQSLSSSSTLAYTPGYAPPEQMEQNSDKFGPWTDLYSLGATLFNLLTLQQPPSPSDMVDNTFDVSGLDSVGEELKQLVIWLMEPNRKQRPQNVKNVVDKCSLMIDSTKIFPSDNSKPSPTPKPTLWLKIFIGFLCLSIVCLVASVVYLIALKNPTNEVSEPASVVEPKQPVAVDSTVTRYNKYVYE